MKRSTASFIPYNLRPSKQAERRILLDFLKCVIEGGISISNARYVGMGGTMFYDFHLLHRFLGVNRMISLERDPDMHPRSEFNNPFDFITVKNETVTEFLAADDDQSPTIYWLDYDDGLGADVTADILALGTKLRVGSCAFVTVYAGAPGVLAKSKREERLDWFREHMGEFSIGLSRDDMDNSQFPNAVYKILMAAFANAFAVRRDGVFCPLFQIRYRDSADMMTIGGCFCPPDAITLIIDKIRRDLPFLFKMRPYRLRNFNLTERERSLFDMAVTKSDLESEAANSLREIGFQERDFDAYRDLLRFLPRYHESII